MIARSSMIVYPINPFIHEKEKQLWNLWCTDIIVKKSLQKYMNYRKR